MKIVAFWLLLLAACDCRSGVVVAPAPGPIVGDASDVCARAIAAAAACGCPWATDAGAVGCRRDQAQGHAAQLAPECLALAPDCGALKACPGAGGCQ